MLHYILNCIPFTAVEIRARLLLTLYTGRNENILQASLGPTRINLLICSLLFSIYDLLRGIFDWRLINNFQI
jgi:hypothetical protein